MDNLNEIRKNNVEKIKETASKPLKTVVYATGVNEFKRDSQKGVVVIDFYADWCPPCKILGPVLERLASEMSFLLVKINTDKSPDEARKFGVQGIPAVYLLRNGKVVDSFVGVKDVSFIKEMVMRWQ